MIDDKRCEGESGMKSKPLIEKYFTHLRVRDEETRARIKREERLDGPGLNYNLVVLNQYTTTYMHMAEQAQKYRMARSGQAMVDALRPRPLLRDELSLTVLSEIAAHTRALDPDIETPVAQVPGAAIWIELDQPILTQNDEIAALFFTCADREIEYQLSLHQPKLVHDMLMDSARKPTSQYRWSLHFINADGVPKTHYEYAEVAQQWAILPGGEPCPTGECVTEEYLDDESFRHYRVIPCPFCSVLLAHWRAWFTTALLTVSGEFAETEDTEWPVQVEEVTRKVARPHSPKYDEVKIRHEYYLVAFDASVKQARTVYPGEVIHRGSWVDAAREINPDAVVYMRKGFGATERLLDPSRNPRWKEKKVVPVRGHDRRIPVRVETLQRRITYVVASKYKDDDING
jgi:hypothetical protein